MKRTILKIALLCGLVIDLHAQNPTLVYGTNGVTTYPDGRHTGMVNVGLDATGSGTISNLTVLDVLRGNLGIFTSNVVINAVITNNMVPGTSDLRGLITGGNGLIISNGLTTLNILNMNGTGVTNAGHGVLSTDLSTVGQMMSSNAVDIARLTNNAVVLGNSLTVLGHVISTNNIVTTNYLGKTVIGNTEVGINNEAGEVNPYLFTQGKIIIGQSGGTAWLRQYNNAQDISTCWDYDLDGGRSALEWETTQYFNKGIYVLPSFLGSTTNAYIDLNGNIRGKGVRLGTAITTTNYLYGRDDYMVFANAANITNTLPLASANKDRIYGCKSLVTNIVAIVPQPGDAIDWDTIMTIGTKGTTLEFMSDGTTNWFVK